MCYNTTSSITSYVYVIFIATILYLYGNIYDKHVSLFFFVVIQMQLAEFFMHVDQKCTYINKFATLLAFILLYAQPISAFAIGKLLNTINTPTYFNYLYICYALYGIIVLGIYILRNKTICSKITNGHLFWDFEPRNDINGYISVFLYLILSTIPWLYLKNVSILYLFITIWIGSWLLHYILYPKHWKSMWCFFVSGMITLYTLGRYLQTYSLL